MKHILSLFTLFSALLSSSFSHSMFSLPLGNLEKQIFLREVNRIGKKAALQKIYETKDPKPSYFIIKTYIEYTPELVIKPLEWSIIQAIQQKEKANGYIPEPITKDGNSWILPNNRLENYTRYWHEEDSRGKPNLWLESDFNDKKSLLELLNKE